MNKRISSLVAALIVTVLFVGCTSSPTANDNVQKDSNILSEENSNIEHEYDEYLFNTEYSIDLDKDGKLDTMLCSNNGEIALITINGKVFEIESYEADLINNKFMIVDIDKNDKCLDIVINKAEPPFGDSLIFYRYSREAFYSLGAISREKLNGEENELTINKDGEIKVLTNSYIMCDGNYNKKYIVGETGLIELPPKEIYTYITPITSKVNKEIRGYTDKTINSSYSNIPAGDEIIIYGEKDNWLNIKWGDTEFWINDNELTHFISDDVFEFEGIRFQS